jgi:hypothetical protein
MDGRGQCADIQSRRVILTALCVFEASCAVIDVELNVFGFTMTPAILEMRFRGVIAAAAFSVSSRSTVAVFQVLASTERWI